ncbi:hypothetical protein CROQUDRAFT_90221 [Cronartium quercuum f. sp. fusiforme G11]|uniref:Uncharacterized protein n=1 Tax=Cronartium quercuum f. sp. fusiforme G11 TaxID=708437 RepID=A0A9P6TDJ6_9BASI|nr:hypothetical protein CROQUDRAFT_90221 [Cronartium quercuum f. sp. fusiforme G11]
MFYLSGFFFYLSNGPFSSFQNFIFKSNPEIASRRPLIEHLRIIIPLHITIIIGIKRGRLLCSIPKRVREGLYTPEKDSFSLLNSSTHLGPVAPCISVASSLYPTVYDIPPRSPVKPLNSRLGGRRGGYEMSCLALHRPRAVFLFKRDGAEYRLPKEQKTKMRKWFLPIIRVLCACRTDTGLRAINFDSH